MPFNLPPWLMNSAFVVGVLSLAGILIRQLGPWKKIASEAEAHFRKELIRRVEKLEHTLDRERVRHNAERALDRHRLNNVTQCFDMLLALIEMAPERASETVRKIKEMRAAQNLAETEEKAIIRAAEIAADEHEADHDGN